MSPLSVIILIIGIFIIVEVSSYFLLKMIHSKTGVYYSPKDKPVLSKRIIDFTERFINENGKGSIKEYNRLLGWTLSPGSQSADGRYKINHFGSRTGNGENSSQQGETVISSFGDCMTFGDKINFEDTFQAQLQNKMTDCHIYNFGVEGYGPAQVYKRYEISTAENIHQDVVIVSFVSTNIFKPINIYRPFYAYDHGMPLGKPGFQIVDGDLRDIKNPFSSLAEYTDLLENPAEKLKSTGAVDHYYQQTYSSGIFDFLSSVKVSKILLNELRKNREVMNKNGTYKYDSNAFKITSEILIRNYNDIKENNSIPLLLLMPVKKDFKNYIKKGIKPWDILLQIFEKEEVKYIDLLDLFKDAAIENLELLFSGRHYSSNANKIIADGLFEYFSSDVELKSKLKMSFTSDSTLVN